MFNISNQPKLLFIFDFFFSFTFEPVAMRVQSLPGCSVTCLLKPHTDDSGLSPATGAGEAPALEHPLGVVKWRRTQAAQAPAPPALKEGKQVSPDQNLVFPKYWASCSCKEGLQAGSQP